MNSFFKKHSTILQISILLTLLVLAWFIPAERLFLGLSFVLTSFLVASAAIVEKHKGAYDQGKVTRRVFLRNALLEVTGGGLAMVLAAMLGKYAAGLAAQQIEDGLLKLIIGLLVGLLVGLGVGALAKKTWGRFVKTGSR
jgi:hypothetical protein